jgi:hypothetical protein
MSILGPGSGGVPSLNRPVACGGSERTVDREHSRAPPSTLSNRERRVDRRSNRPASIRAVPRPIRSSSLFVTASGRSERATEPQRPRPRFSSSVAAVLINADFNDRPHTHCACLHALRRAQRLATLPREPFLKFFALSRSTGRRSPRSILAANLPRGRSCASS